MLAPACDNIDVEDGLHDRFPTTPAAAAVSPEESAQDEASARELQQYNSLDVAVDVSIDNRAWFPDLGSVSETNLDRLTSLMRSDGFDVVRAVPLCIHLSTWVLNMPVILVEQLGLI